MKMITKQKLGNTADIWWEDENGKSRGLCI